MEHNLKIEYEEISELSNDLLNVYRKTDKETCIYPVKEGLFALIDFEDKEKVISAGKWLAQKTQSGVYLFTNINGKRIYLQNFISEMNNITFKNKITLDCRKENLIGGTRKAVMRLRRGKRNTTSKYKGICMRTEEGIWSVAIKYGNGRLYLGRYKNEIVAAKVYDQAAKIIFKETAYLNFPGENTEQYRNIILKYIESRELRLSKQDKDNNTNNNIKSLPSRHQINHPSL